MGTCPHCGAEVTVRADLVPPEADADDTVSMPDEASIRLEQGDRTCQYVRPDCDAILGAGTHTWAR